MNRFSVNNSHPGLRSLRKSEPNSKQACVVYASQKLIVFDEKYSIFAGSKNLTEIDEFPDQIECYTGNF